MDTKKQMDRDGDDERNDNGGDTKKKGFDYRFNFFKKRKIESNDANVHTTIDIPSSNDDENGSWSNNDNNNNKNNNKDTKRVMESYTCMLASDLKRVQPKDLSDKCMNQPTEKEIGLENKRRNKCKLFFLMTAATIEEVNQYVELAFMSLKVDHIYPFDNAWTEQFDRELSAKNIDFIRKSPDIVVKRAFIWLALFLSRKFVTVFCPRRTDPSDTSNEGMDSTFNRRTKEFTVNPDLLGPFVTAKDSALSFVVSARLVGLINTGQLVAIATKLWMELQPWNDHEIWGNLDADELGNNVRLIMAPPSKHIHNAIEGPNDNQMLANDSE